MFSLKECEKYAHRVLDQAKTKPYKVRVECRYEFKSEGLLKQSGR